MAVSIILNAVQLMTSTNGSLIVNWLVESSNLPNRWMVLVPRVKPALTKLLLHRIASAILLKVVAQTDDLNAANMLLDAMFESSQNMCLIQVLQDQIHGVSIICKILQIPHLSEERQTRMREATQDAVTRLDGLQNVVYQRLLDKGGSTPSQLGHSQFSQHGRGQQYGFSARQGGFNKFSPPSSHISSPLASRYGSTPSMTPSHALPQN